MKKKDFAKEKNGVEKKDLFVKTVQKNNDVTKILDVKTFQKKKTVKKILVVKIFKQDDDSKLMINFFKKNDESERIPNVETNEKIDDINTRKWKKNKRIMKMFKFIVNDNDINESIISFVTNDIDEIRNANDHVSTSFITKPPFKKKIDCDHSRITVWKICETIEDCRLESVFRCFKKKAEDRYSCDSKFYSSDSKT